MTLKRDILLRLEWMENQLERFITMTESNQAHLDQDVSAIVAGFAEVVAELKAQAASGAPLDFTNADALVASVQAEATADAPHTTEGTGSTPVQ